MMRPEVMQWWNQGRRDLISAINSYKSGDYYASVFWVQQSVEKCLKSYFMFRLKKSPGVTHSLIYLANETKIDRKFFGFLRTLNPEFISTRYPDIAGEEAHLLYDEDIAKKFLDGAEEFLKWLEKKMNL